MSTFNKIFILLFITVFLIGIDLASAQEAPEPPVNVAAVAVDGLEQIKVSWDASPSEDITFYHIYRSTSLITVGSVININNPESLSFTDTDVQYKTTYYYRVTSESAAEQSDYSEVASAKPLMLVPINVQEQDAGNNKDVRITWDKPVEGLLLWYDVYRSTNTKVNGPKIAAKIRETEFTDDDLDDRVVYYYSVRSVDTDDNKSVHSDFVSISISKDIGDSAPPKVTLKRLSKNGVQVSWKKPSNKEVSSYLVYRSRSETDLGTLRIETTKRSFSEYSLDPGSTYYYRIKSVDEDGNVSDKSDSASITIKKGDENALLPPVTSIAAKATGKEGQIKLTWKKPSSSNFSYVRIFRSTESDAGSARIANKIKGKLFTDKKLKNGITYYYTIRTVSKNGSEGAPSDEVSAAPFTRSKKSQPPPPISRLRVKDVGDGKTLKLTWRNPILHLYKYLKIYRSTSIDILGNPVINRLRDNEYKDADGITAGQRYYYTIKTVDSNGLESEDNITVRGIASTALPGEVGTNDADGDGLPDVWERKFGYNAHLKDVIEQDDDNDGLGVYAEFKNNTDPWNPDSDLDGYSDGTEVLNEYNPLGAGRAAQVKKIAAKVKKGGSFAYSKNRLSSISDEATLASELRELLEFEFGSGKIPNPRKHWHKLVNAYIYGGYSVLEIAHTLRKGPGLVHPSVPAQTWRESDEYKKKNI